MLVTRHKPVARLQKKYKRQPGIANPLEDRTDNRQEKVCCGGHILSLGKTQHMIGDKKY